MRKIKIDGFTLYNQSQSSAQNKSRGFTLMELLVYVGVFSVASVFLSNILITVTNISTRESANKEVSSQLNTTFETIQQLIQESSNIESASGSTLKLRMPDPAKDPTCVTLESGVIKIAEGPGATPNACSTTKTDLTTNRVTANSLVFTKIENIKYSATEGKDLVGHSVVNIDASLTYNTVNPRYQISRTLTSAVGRVSAATFDSDLLPDTTGLRNIGTSALKWQNLNVNGTAYFAGNVGIGTSAPAASLDVTGMIRSKTGYLLNGNMLDTTVWVISTGSSGGFSVNGAATENERVWGVDPFGRPAMLWKSINDAGSDADGGWNYSNIPINNNKAYRLSVWIKKNGITSGSIYLGCSGSNTLNLNGTANTNPYFKSASASSFIDGRWYLWVGYIHANNDASTTSYSAIYDGVTGKKVLSGTDFKNAGSNNYQTHRSYNYYDTVVGSEQYFWGPRFEELDGFEPSVEALLGVPQGATNEVISYFGGNVGIGTASPNYKQEINGILGFTVASASYRRAITPTYFGYGQSWKAFMFGSSSTNYNVADGAVSLFFNYDPSINASASFIGDGSEIFFRNGTKFVTPNATDTSFSLDLALKDGNVGIGTGTPGAKLEVAGQIKITGGVPGAGKVLTSDAAGLASWQDSGISSFIGTTAATYTGILGGYSGANAKCATDFSGSHMCSGTEILASLPAASCWYSTLAQICWVDYGCAADCWGWTREDARYYGQSWNTSSGGISFCSTARTICCCK